MITIYLVIAIILILIRFILITEFINYYILSYKNKNGLIPLMFKFVKIWVVTLLMKHYDPLVVQQLSFILHMLDISSDDVLYNFLPSDKTAQIIVVVGATIIFGVLIIIVFSALGPIPIEDAAPSIEPANWAGLSANVRNARVVVE